MSHNLLSVRMLGVYVVVSQSLAIAIVLALG